MWGTPWASRRTVTGAESPARCKSPSSTGSAALAAARSQSTPAPAASNSRASRPPAIRSRILGQRRLRLRGGDSPPGAGVRSRESVSGIGHPQDNAAAMPEPRGELDSWSLVKTIVLPPRAEILRQLAGLELSVLVENGAAATAIAEKASIHAGNSLHRLVARQVTLLELAAGIKGHHRALARTQPTAAHAGHV